MANSTESRREEIRKYLAKGGYSLENLQDFLESSDVKKKSEEKINYYDISECLHKLGVPSYVNGFRYLQYALQIAMNDFSFVYGKTTELYDELSKKFDIRPELLERSIRHAILMACSSRESDNYSELFGFNVDWKKKNPSNGEFIAIVAGYMKAKLCET